MKHIKLFENFEIESPILMLVDKINNILNYEYINDDEIKIEVKSGNDKSDICPNSIVYLIKFTGEHELYDAVAAAITKKYYKPVKEYSFDIKCLYNHHHIGKYFLTEAIPVIQYYYRNIE